MPLKRMITGKKPRRKEAGVLQSQVDECRAYDQVLAHIAHQQIELDLDDGVKMKYAKFQGVEVRKTMVMLRR